MGRKNLTNKTKKEKREPIPKKKVVISIFLIGFAFLGSYLIYFILQIALNTSTPMVVVVSGSMEPNINKGDLLFLQGVDPEDIEVGDVIVYDAHGLWLGAPDDPIVHRVIDIFKEDGKLYFVTKGDANREGIDEPVGFDRIVGKLAQIERDGLKINYESPLWEKYLNKHIAKSSVRHGRRLRFFAPYISVALEWKWFLLDDI